MAHSRLPLTIIILLSFLVAGTFFVGTLQIFDPARTAMNLEALQEEAFPPPMEEAPESHQGMTVLLSSSQIGEDTLEPTLVPITTPSASAISDVGYAGTTGIFALAIVVVLVILVGLIWGSRSPRNRQE